MNEPIDELRTIVDAGEFDPIDHADLVVKCVLRLDLEMAELRFASEHAERAASQKETSASTGVLAALAGFAINIVGIAVPYVLAAGVMRAFGQPFWDSFWMLVKWSIIGTLAIAAIGYGGVVIAMAFSRKKR